MYISEHPNSKPENAVRVKVDISRKTHPVNNRRYQRLSAEETVHSLGKSLSPEISFKIPGS
jgi:hypothetical protein